MMSKANIPEKADKMWLYFHKRKNNFANVGILCWLIREPANYMLKWILWWRLKHQPLPKHWLGFTSLLRDVNDTHDDALAENRDLGYLCLQNLREGACWKFYNCRLGATMAWEAEMLQTPWTMHNRRSGLAVCTVIRKTWIETVLIKGGIKLHVLQTKICIIHDTYFMIDMAAWCTGDISLGLQWGVMPHSLKVLMNARLM